MLKIKDITINGLKSYYSEAKIDFQSGTTVILGPNGAGKSTLLESIKYALFGEFMDKNQKISDFINDSNNFEIEMLFEYDKKEYLVRREVKLTGKDQKRPRYRDEITLPNGETIPNKRDVDLKIRNDILGITSKIMDTASFVSQGSLQEIIGLQGAKLRKEFSEILQLNRFEELKSVWNTMKIRYGGEIDKLEQKYQKYMVEVDKIPIVEQQLSNLHLELQVLAKRYQQLEKEKLKLNEIRLERNYLQNQDKKVNQNVIDLEGKINQKKEDLAQLSTKLHNIELTHVDKNIVNSLKEKSEAMEKERMELTSFYQKSLQFQSPIRLLKNQIRAQQRKLETTSDQLAQTKNKFTNIDLKITLNPKASINNFEKKLEYLNREQMEIGDQFVRFREFREKEAEISTLSLQIKHSNVNLSKYDDLGLSELSGITNSTQTTLRKIVDRVFTILDDLRIQCDKEQNQIEEIQINLQKLEFELESKAKIIKELETKGEHECKTCYSIITKERIEETILRSRKFISTNKRIVTRYQKQIAKHENTISVVKPILDVYEQFNQIYNDTPLLKLMANRNNLIDELTKVNIIRKQILDQSDLTSTSEQKLNIRNREISIQVREITKILETLNQKLKSENEIQKLEEQLKTLENGLHQLYEENHIESGNSLDQVNKEINAMKVELTRINHDITNSQLILQLIGSLETFSQELESKKMEQEIIETKLSGSKYLEIDQNWKNISDAFENTRVVQSAKQREVGGKNNEITNLRKFEGKAEEINVEIIKKQKMESTTKEMEKIFAKIHPEILQQKTKNIEYRTNEMLNQFPSDSGIFNIEIDRKFNLNIRRRNNAKRLSTHTLSGGEKMSAAFALRVAMSKELIDIGFMVLDEPTDGLDHERRKLLAEIIANQRHVKQLLVVTHDDAFNGRTDNTIMVKQINGTTELIQNTQLKDHIKNDESQFDEF